MNDESIVMLRSRCQGEKCGMVTVGTEEAMRKFPHCPFCGGDVDVEPLGSADDGRSQS